MKSTSPNGLFVTGTDTGVGKTLVTAALARCLARRGLRVGVMKPIETGWTRESGSPSDAMRLQMASGSTHPPDLVSPYRLGPPLAPACAAAAEDEVIDLDRIERAYHEIASHYDMTLVEGVGGVLVPITPDSDVRDLMVRLALPVVVVGRTALGGVNHARLTLEALGAVQLRVLAVVLNQTEPAATEVAVEQERSTMDLIRNCTRVPVLGPLPFQPELGRSWSECLDRFTEDPHINALADFTNETC